MFSLGFDSILGIRKGYHIHSDKDDVDEGKTRNNELDELENTEGKFLNSFRISIGSTSYSDGFVSDNTISITDKIVGITWCYISSNHTNEYYEENLRDFLCHVNEYSDIQKSRKGILFICGNLFLKIFDNTLELVLFRAFTVCFALQEFIFHIECEDTSFVFLFYVSAPSCELMAFHDDATDFHFAIIEFLDESIKNSTEI